MTKEQLCTIETAIDEAIAQARATLPNGTDEQLTEWVMEHQRPFTDDLQDALAEEGRKALIRDAARELAVTLQE